MTLVNDCFGRLGGESITQTPTTLYSGGDLGETPGELLFGGDIGQPICVPLQTTHASLLSTVALPTGLFPINAATDAVVSGLGGPIRVLSGLGDVVISATAQAALNRLVSGAAALLIEAVSSVTQQRIQSTGAAASAEAVVVGFLNVLGEFLFIAQCSLIADGVVGRLTQMTADTAVNITTEGVIRPVKQMTGVVGAELTDGGSLYAVKTVDVSSAISIVAEMIVNRLTGLNGGIGVTSGVEGGFTPHETLLGLIQTSLTTQAGLRSISSLSGAILSELEALLSPAPPTLIQGGATANLTASAGGVIVQKLKGLAATDLYTQADYTAIEWLKGVVGTAATLGADLSEPEYITALSTAILQTEAAIHKRLSLGGVTAAQASADLVIRLKETLQSLVNATGSTSGKFSGGRVRIEVITAILRELVTELEDGTLRVYKTEDQFAISVID